ncbi:MAG: aminotransferase class I/II-fold pyridoxal phosphate-dependent enzyme [Candidatus Aenigmatarchaeota archaeon]
MLKAAERTLQAKSAIRDVEAYGKELEKKGRKILHLNIGDPDAFDFDTPEHLRNALKAAVDTKKNGYCESVGLPELREAVKERMKRDYNAKADDVVVTAGLSEAISFIFNALLDPGDRVLMPAPLYPPYFSMASMLGAKPVLYNCKKEDGWQPDVDDIRKKIDAKTKCVVLINPNNPTGAVYDKKTVKAVVDLAGEHGLLVISDEIYDKLTFDKPHICAASLAGDVPVLTLNGLSKVYLAPGWRLGWVAFTDNAQQMTAFKEAMVKLCRMRLCASNPVQNAAVAALTGGREYLIETVRKLKERRDFVCKRVGEIEGLSVSRPEGAFYAFPGVEGPWKDDKTFVTELVEETGVLVVHGSGFQAEGKHFRTVLLPPLPVLDEAFVKIEKFMKKR